MTGNVWLSADPEVLREMARRKGPVRGLFILGYSGWAPGQLESELARDDWAIAPGDTELLFDPDLASKWRRAWDIAGWICRAADGPLVPPPIRARLAPMNADVESLVLEQLRAIRAKVDKIDDDLGDLRQRMSSVERHMANLQGDVATSTNASIGRASASIESNGASI